MPHSPISLVINNYNYGAQLGRAIDSALAQEPPPAEVIVVDDGSTDASRAVMAGYGARIRCILQPNRGQAAAINAGVAAARAPLIAFLDADDWCLPGRMAALTAAFARAPGAGLVYHRLRPMLPDGTPVLRPLPRSLCRGNLAPRLWRTAGVWPYPMTSALALRRESWEAAGPIPERFRISADAWIVGIQPLLGPVVALPEALGAYRIHANAWFRAEDDAPMLARRVAHWQAVVEETNAFLARRGAPRRLSLADHFPLRLAQARLAGAGPAERLRLLAAGLRDASEPNPLRRARDTLRAVRGLRTAPMVGSRARGAAEPAPEPRG
ncbi:glycosyltransferase family 2 protein [Oceanicella sp. SM1341]|uniref:glycosyltransferase family 2 protein n=1 Tax=Oceanicella sp. SM1341 TaxID=1548889 RepID=UPI000E550C0B|nr:glycosyltransferase family 2 protein [Oceanicella sp. SM1341]